MGTGKKIILFFIGQRHSFLELLLIGIYGVVACHFGRSWALFVFSSLFFTILVLLESYIRGLLDGD